MTTWATFTSSSTTSGAWIPFPVATTTTNDRVRLTSFTGAPSAFVATGGLPDPAVTLAEMLTKGLDLVIPSGWRGDIRLPDGTILRNKGGDNFEVLDRDARVTYRGNRDRAFNRHVNASDLLEGFIDFLGGLGVPQHRLLDIPIDVFIHWLIAEAARQDGQDVPDGVTVETHPKLALGSSTRHADRCRSCGRFIGRRTVQEGFLYCSLEHYARRATVKE